ncbi:N-acetyltransferase [Allostella vacuolata]|nr:N-acetyltransferase [Stella vacuolata]
MIAGLRRAMVADATRVAALVDRAYGHYVARIGQKPYPMTVDYAEAIGAMRGFVVERDWRIVGLLLLDEARDHVMVENVAVDPGLQGTGLGRQLMQLAEDEALAAGLTELRLYTHQMMTENQAIYRRLGYVEFDRRTVGGRPRVYMRKSLARRFPLS